ncbi:MAG: hypothetical protein WA210_22005 [Burkholderiaceae bacterium]
MKVNLFEGSRRVALAFGAMWLIGFVAFALFSDPYAHMTYSVVGPGLETTQVEKCGDADAREHTYTHARGGGRISVELCLKAHKSDGGELLVPYAPASDGRWWMAGPYTSEVKRYARELARDFQIPTSDLDEADGRSRQALMKQWKEAMLWGFGGLAIGWVLVAGIGWIVRGFMGIPRGKDSHSEA